MSENGGITMLDGTHLRSLHVSLPESITTLTGAQLLEFADSKASDSLFGFVLPQSLKFSAFQRLNITDDVTFRRNELTRESAVDHLQLYLTAIADQLQENPMVVSVLDGSALRMFLEDEDDFAMLAENLFTELDTEDKGKISKSEIMNALVHMGVGMGVPPFQEFPLLNDISKKHAVGEGDLGQSQFAELLQPILQEVADSLALKPVVIVQNVKIADGSELRKLLIDEKRLNNVTEKIVQSKKDGRNTELIRTFLEKHGKELGLPPLQANEDVVLLSDAVFAEVESGNCAAETDNEFRELVKLTLEKFVEQLEANPIFWDPDH